MIRKLLRVHLLFLLILIAGIFLRVVKPIEYLPYAHDQDLAGWVIKDVLVNKHLRLIGQETSSRGLFIGPITYYLLIPFYLIFNMDPIAAIPLYLIISAFTIFSFYFVLGKVFDKRIGIIAALIYAVSYNLIFSDRNYVPTMPVMLWGIWYFYSLFMLLKGDNRGYPLTGILAGLVWHISLGLGVLLPLSALAQIFSAKKINLKALAIGVLLFMGLMLPFFVFEIKHGFIQAQSIVSSLTTNKDYVAGVGKGLAKLDRVVFLVFKNTSRLVWGPKLVFGQHLALIVMIIFLTLGAIRGLIGSKIVWLMLLWQVAYIAFFTANPINVSEYYLDGMSVIWIVLLAVGTACLLSSKARPIGILFLSSVVVFNLYSFLNHSTNKNGYMERKAVVAFIDEDAKEHGYPCVSASYITNPGYDLGYRYFYWLKGLKVQRPISGAPVYTIVFPPALVNRVDRTFGGIGLVLPDYKIYTKDVIERGCRGEDSNLTYPMFGYTQ